MRTRAPSLVGRDTELDGVRRALGHAQDGKGSSLFLVGEAGIGKTRLAAEAVSQAFAAGMVVLRGRGSTLGPMVPFRPLTEALLSLVRRGELPGDAELGPYRPVLGRLVPDWGIDDGFAGASLVVLAEAVLRLTSVVGRDRGCLLVLEDLHDVDVETLAVIEYLTDNLDGQPTVLLGTVRAEAVETVEVVRSAARRQAGAIMELNRLSRADTVALMGSCLDVDPADVPAAAVDLMWHNSVGNPLMVEELLHGMISGGQLVRGPDGWRLVPDVRTEVPATLMRSLTVRTERLDAAGRAVLTAAAVLGQRFSLTVLQRITAMDDHTLLSQLHTLVRAQLVASDERGPDWYAFQHPLIAEALLAQLPPVDRVVFSRKAAEAVAALHPELPGEWCQLAATLWLAAGDIVAAARLFADAGRRALADGAAGSAIALLDKAERLLDEHGDTAGRAEVLETLLYALAEANELERAFTLAENLGGDSGIDPPRRVALCVRLAWLACIAGRWEMGMAQIAEARAILGPAAAIDAAAAHLVLDMPGPQRLTEAESLARAALAATDDPLVRCQALHVLGIITREWDLDESNTCFESVRSIAEKHRLPIWRTYGRTGPANNAWLADGDVDALAAASKEAMQVGAINVGNSLEAVRTLDTVLCGHFDEATALLEEQLATARKLQLLVVERYLLMTSAVRAAHQGQRPEMELAYAQFQARGGNRSRELPLAVGMARAFCALLEEEPDRAHQEFEVVLASQRDNPTTFYLAGRHGLYPLLLSLDPDTRPADVERLTSVAVAEMRWNRQFVRMAQAVLLGREGRFEAAEQAMASALAAAARYPLARHLGLRLVAESAHAHGWGEPVAWLRQAEDYFHHASVPTVAGACRAALRRIGVPVLQHRMDSDRIPGRLRERGVTLREYEVYELLVARLGNKEIAARLHISPRTVEKHVASLLTKTDRTNRATLIADNPV
jgi:DNA-binding CsgD family transcriptional regulator